MDFQSFNVVWPTMYKFAACAIVSGFQPSPGFSSLPLLHFHLEFSSILAFLKKSAAAAAADSNNNNFISDSNNNSTTLSSKLLQYADDTVAQVPDLLIPGGQLRMGSVVTPAVFCAGFL